MVVLKELILTVSTLGGGGSGGLKRIDFNSFYFGEEVVVLKNMILSFYFGGRKWWS